MSISAYYFEEGNPQQTCLGVLVGKKVITGYVNPGKERLYLLAEDLTTNIALYYEFETQNDCCNSVWFEHLENFCYLFGGIVTQIIAKECITKEDDPEHEVLDIGWWDIVTHKGVATLEVRNSHNGYYGGSIHFVGTRTDLPKDAGKLKELLWQD